MNNISLFELKNSNKRDVFEYWNSSFNWILERSNSIKDLFHSIRQLSNWIRIESSLNIWVSVNLAFYTGHLWQLHVINLQMWCPDIDQRNLPGGRDLGHPDADCEICSEYGQQDRLCSLQRRVGVARATCSAPLDYWGMVLHQFVQLSNPPLIHALVFPDNRRYCIR